MSGIDGQYLGELLDAHAAALELVARQWCRQPADVVQEAFIRLARLPAQPDNAVAWLYRAVRNGAISAARSTSRRTRHEQAAAAGRDWFRPAAAGIDAAEAGEQLSALPAEEREIIVLHLWGGLSFEQIAGITGLSSSTAHRRYQNGLQTLRTKLGAVCPRATTT